MLWTAARTLRKRLWCKWHGPIGYAGGVNEPRSAMATLKTGVTAAIDKGACNAVPLLRKLRRDIEGGMRDKALVLAESLFADVQAPPAAA